MPWATDSTPPNSTIRDCCLCHSLILCLCAMDFLLQLEDGPSELRENRSLNKVSLILELQDVPRHPSVMTLALAFSQSLPPCCWCPRRASEVTHPTGGEAADAATTKLWEVNPRVPIPSPKPGWRACLLFFSHPEVRRATNPAGKDSKL